MRQGLVAHSLTSVFGKRRKGGKKKVLVSGDHRVTLGG